MSRLPAGIIGAAGEVQRTLSSAGFRFCFIGGVALQRWGEQRYTRDVDLTLLCPFGEELATARRLAALLRTRVEAAREFAVESRMFLAQSMDGTPVDIAFGGIDFEVRCVGRASPFDFGGGFSLVTCSAEDLVVMKAFAGRDQDWLDIESIIVRQGERLDWKLIDRELGPLLSAKEEGSGPTVRRLDALRLNLRRE
jgi:hypothetical protein